MRGVLGGRRVRRVRLARPWDNLGNRFPAHAAFHGGPHEEAGQAQAPTDLKGDGRGGHGADRGDRKLRKPPLRLHESWVGDAGDAQGRLATQSWRAWEHGVAAITVPRNVVDLSCGDGCANRAGPIDEPAVVPHSEASPPRSWWRS